MVDDLSEVAVTLVVGGVRIEHIPCGARLYRFEASASVTLDVLTMAAYSHTCGRLKGEE